MYRLTVIFKNADKPNVVRVVPYKPLACDTGIDGTCGTLLIPAGENPFSAEGCPLLIPGCEVFNWHAEVL